MSNLRSRIAARLEQKKQAQAKKAAQVRVAAAWTIAKTMLPGAPAGVQEKFASALMTNSTSVLAAALRQTAVNAHYTKLAEKLEDVHKVSLNDLMEDESLLKKLQGEVKKELKADDATKVAKAKKADEGDEAPKDGEEPKAEGEEAPAGDMPPAPDMPAAPAPSGDMPPADLPGAMIPAEEKIELHNQIEQVEDDVMGLEHEIMDAEEHELDIAAAFNEDTAESKKMNLANEEDAHDEQFEIDVKWDDDAENIADPERDHEEQEEDGMFGPSSVESMEASLDGESEMDVASTSDAADFFSDGTKEASAVDQLGALMSRKANDVIKPGDAAAEFEADHGADDRDSETDHEDSLLFDLIKGLGQESFEDELGRPTEPNLEMPKAAKAKAAALAPKQVVRAKGGKPVKTLGDVSGKKTAGDEASKIASLLFGDDEI